MKYIKIPIESMAEGKKFAEEIFGAMMWNNEEENIIMAYPYDSDNPIVMTNKILQKDG